MAINNNNRVKNQEREARLEIVAEMYKRGNSLRKIQSECETRLGKRPSLNTLTRDRERLLQEWREARISAMDDNIELELARIDACLVELWEQWEKSKEDYTRARRKRIGVPVPDGNSGEATNIETIRREQEETDVVGLGDVSYIAEIRQQLVERRKLLGLYAVRKTEVSGEITTAVEVKNMSEDAIKAEIARIRASIGKTE